MKRIKTLSQKLTDGSFSSPFPLGVDSIYADMLSGNNLEQEMHLGCPSLTSFETDSSGNVTITEEYKEENQTTKYYKMLTGFVTANDETSIIQKLYYIDDNGTETLEKTKTVTFVTINDNLQIKEVIE